MKTKLVISLIPWAAQVLYVSYTWWFLWYYETWPGLVTEAVYVFFIAATLYLFALNRSNSVRSGVKIAINKMFAVSFVPLHLAAMVSATSPYLPLAFDLPPSRESKANAAAALSNMYHLRTHTNEMPLLK